VPRLSLKILTQEYVEEAERMDAERREEKSLRPVEGFPFWPHEMVRNIVIVCFFTAALLYLAAFMPYYLEGPANPAGQPEVILPDWYLLWSYGFLKLGNDLTILNGPDGVWVDEWWHFWDRQWWTPWDMGPSTAIVQLPIIGPMNAKLMGLIGLHTPVLLPLVLIPFLDRGKAQRPQEQPFMTALGVFALGLMTTASVYSINNVIYERWPVTATKFGSDVIGPFFQFLQWDLLSWMSVLLPLVLSVLTYVGIKTWRERMMEEGDRVFQLNRNYYRVR
jgi:quinol-cytochrome oxidoreductase complex cytochrome b subunit